MLDVAAQTRIHDTFDDLIANLRDFRLECDAEDDARKAEFLRGSERPTFSLRWDRNARSRDHQDIALVFSRRQGAA